ncbi:hypothetical protein [Pelagerythrobacter sp.]|uniref:hypothetical protein n=1 Tax=Pelagerythrobacter sp. TaxID=2800702 RepID=UPI0035B11F4B
MAFTPAAVRRAPRQDTAPDAPPASAAPTNLPALIEALSGDAARPQQTEFTRARQVQFLLALADSGAVRRAVKAAGVSHQTAYRMRRATPAFRLAWDAALLAARAVTADVLATRALDGVEEKVFYHGEEVATRRRYDSRLLLAHLARLDRLDGDAATHAFAEDFEEALARFERGEPQPEPDAEATTSAHPEPVGSEADPQGQRAQCNRAASTLRQAQGEREGDGRQFARAGDPDFSSPGQCNNRSMSPLERGKGGHGEGGGSAPAAAGPRAVPPGRKLPPGYDTWLPDMDDPAHWRGGEYIPPYCRRLDAMDAARPPGARPPASFPGTCAYVGEVEAEQLAAFEAGVEHWWLVVPPGPGDDPDAWYFADEE